MEKRLMLVLFALLILSSVSAATIDNRLTNIADNQKVNVIVRLADSSSGMIGASSLSKRMSVAESLGSSYNITYVGKTVNAISMQVTKAQLAQLAARSDVSQITLAPKLHIMLQQSVPLINATLAWSLQAQGLNLTGAGQTICIIDTGVNYTHPDLGGCSNSTFLAGNCSKVIGGYDFVNNDSDPMDDNGHGTHVSGIAAANGTINGVAPGAKIVMIKVCGPGGNDCDTVAVADGINWCINNASKFNISVISISLGDTTQQYTNHSACDIDDAGLIRIPISNAVAKNITVVIASGNENSNTGISSPACLSNATAVGATDKNDNIPSYSNRAAIMSLLAPGGISSNEVDGINSTSYLGGYVGKFGTSMATPHVAGAIAILEQLLALEGQTRTPMQITSILNNTGKRINDISTGINYTRINVYNAVLSIDTIAPSVTLISPQLGLVTTNTSLVFSANVTDWQLKNMTFTLVNSSGQTINQTFNITGQVNSTSINITGLSVGNYNWTFSAMDARMNQGSTTGSFTIVPEIYSLDSPDDAIYVKASSNTFTCSAQTSTLLSNITLYIQNTTTVLSSQTNNVTGQMESTSFDYSFASGLNYTWYCSYGLQNGTTMFSNTNRTIQVDKDKPGVILVSPSNGDNFDGDWYSVTFTFKVSDNVEVSSCTINTYGDNTPSPKACSINNKTYTKDCTIPNIQAGSYDWDVTCTDEVGNSATSTSRRSFDITAPKDSSSGSSSGSSSSSSSSSADDNSLPQYTFAPSPTQTREGYTQVLSKSQTIGFALPASPNNEHKLTVISLNSVYANISVESTPIYLILGKGQSAKLNLTNISTYDLSIRINQVTDAKVNITLQTINEVIPSSVDTTGSTSSGGVGNIAKTVYQNFKKNLWIWIAVWAVVIIIAAVVIFFVMRHRRRTGKSVKSSKNSKHVR